MRTFLESERDLAIVGELSDAQCVHSLTWHLKPDILLIDLALFYSLKNGTETLPGSARS